MLLVALLGIWGAPAIVTGVVNSVPFRMRRALDPVASAAPTVAQARIVYWSRPL